MTGSKNRRLPAGWQLSVPTLITVRMQIVVDGVERQFQTVGNAQLVEDVVQVVFYRSARWMNIFSAIS